ncbi:cystathionine gamma-synthase family protein [Caballeronia concitans]|uniref:O-acetylhomoserine/O-acetylserine sulfhydrylase n=1 Tax=Caballeronia concitans TaxID=1777133 RepID=A0A658QY91_9BURK|nr:cystathionine gamma-synthase family protein [Caballeronia concitans]KIG11310.1 Cystathionine gamma-synthase [Burkholderia sp. MR1]SAL32410.1 O-acetylhomoserine/O-acetylserine sulfhydrylase [Caballeronia concitans]
MDKQGFTTGIVHGDRNTGVEHGGLRQPIHTSVQYGFDRVEDLIGVFQGTKKGGFNYARQGTPTTAALERKITNLEEGVGSICFSTGMAAITAVFLTLLRAGDHLVASRYVFGNTNSLFGTLRTLGVEVTTVDAGSRQNVADAIKPNTRMVFVETIANPGTQIPDLEGIGELCRERGLAYVVDNTITSPALFRPKDVGASLVINSLTKTIAGHGAALGGAVTDTGRFDWSQYPNIADDYRRSAPKEQGLLQIRKKGLRDMGAALSSEQAHQIALGAETLALRVGKCSDNALALARFLERHDAIGNVFYPGLESHPQHGIAKSLFKSGSWLLSFELRNPEKMVDVINALKLPVKATGLGDTRTLIIPVAPTIFFEAGADTRKAMGISDGMIRLSAGIEEIDDLIADFEQALRLA